MKIKILSIYDRYNSLLNLIKKTGKNSAQQPIKNITKESSDVNKTKGIK